MSIPISSLFFALAQVSFPVQAPRDAHRLESSRLRDSAAAEELRFFYRWQAAWRASEAGRHDIHVRVLDGPGYLPTYRVAHVLCSFGFGTDEFISKGVQGGRAIPNLNLHTGVCPSWVGDSVADESHGIDNALTKDRQGEVRAHRSRLIDVLDSAVALYPRDDWLIGQLVRFLVDQRELDRAVTAAESCRARVSWCRSLQGYVFAARGEFVRSEQSFDAALAAESDSVRCEWLDVHSLIDTTAQRSYLKHPCRERVELANRVWWLSDPLYLDPGNERRVEQFVRRVALDLKSALYRDERWEWRPEEGGAARRELITRFGWPSYTWWGGYKYDLIHGCSCIPPNYKPDHYKPANDVATTYEYATSRLHFLPAWTAVLNPFEATFDDWTLSDPSAIPGRTDSFRGLANWRRPITMSWNVGDATSFMRMAWWPAEFAASSRPVVQLPEGQIALLRRDSSVMIAVASDLRSPQLARPDGAPIVASLVATPHPDSIVVVAKQTTRVGAHFVPRGLIPARATIIGIEFLNDGAAPAGRLRFGVQPPQSLQAMGPADRDVSPPVLVASDETLERNVTVDEALDRMTTSVTFSRDQHVGVYWESYGYQPTDTVSIVMWVERYTPQGLLRKLGNSLSLSRDPNTPIAVSWQETRPPSNAYVNAGRVPVIGRTVTLDISALPAGDYWIDIAMSSPGRDPVRSRRGFSIK